MVFFYNIRHIKKVNSVAQKGKNSNFICRIHNTWQVTAPVQSLLANPKFLNVLTSGSSKVRVLTFLKS